MQLYLLPAAFQAVEAALAEEGEVTPELAAKLDALDVALKEKLDGCCRVMRRFLAEAEACHVEARRLTLRAQAAAGRAAWLKDYMGRCLTGLGIDRMDTELFRLRMCKNPPAVSIAEGAFDRLPPDYRRVAIEADKAALLEAYRAGRPLPEGVTITQSRSLRVS